MAVAAVGVALAYGPRMGGAGQGGSQAGMAAGLPS